MVATTNCYAFNRSSYIFTPEDWDRLLSKLQDGYSITAAARAIGASRQAVYDHMERDPAFRSAVQQCQEEGTDTLEDWMLDKARDKAGFLANIACLKARRRAKWGDTQVLDISVHGTINVYNVASALAKLEQEREAAIAGECRVIGIDAPQELRDTAAGEDKGRSYDGNDST